jgi:hypothetical protein
VNYNQIAVFSFFDELDKLANYKKKKKPKPRREFFNYIRRVRREMKTRNWRRKSGAVGAYNRSAKY